LAELRWVARLQPNQIGVIVKDGVVTLTGWVDSYFNMHRLSSRTAIERPLGYPRTICAAIGNRNRKTRAVRCSSTSLTRKRYGLRETALQLRSPQSSIEGGRLCAPSSRCSRGYLDIGTPLA
jgi:hypothetical protein